MLPVFALLFSAAMKLARPPAVIEGFHKFGYPDHLIRVLGVVELACAIIYLIPRTAVLGAVLCTGYLGGAVATHARMDDPQFVMPFLCGVLLWLGLFLRDRRLRELLPFRSK
ncbi:MAG TPA: DoxX family protein [Tepidisphaeraceae bacterium]|nr:DoxX family protein [Tepidisphaeraceae bacterium]